MSRVVLVALIAIPFFSHAQTTPESNASAQEEPAAVSAVAPTAEPTTPPAPTLERIEVTGSHIKRIDSEGASPVKTITRAELEKSGLNSVGDVLRETTANSFGSLREASGSNAAGVAHVDLRGLGSTNTLVLLNGQRLPSDAVTGAVDLNLIPMAAVERVEVLKDGASAIYGSDALGGVVNIITRKDFKGTEVSLTESVPQLKGGQKQQISVVNGINGEKFNMVNVVQYRDNQKIFSKDRDWTNNRVSNIGSPGSYRNAGATWNADPNCPAGHVLTTPQGNFCTFNTSDYSTELPALQQLSLLSESHYEFNSNVRFVARLGGSQKKVQWSYAPAPGTFVIPGSVADTLGPGGGPLPGVTPGQDVQVNYRLADLGNRDTEIETKSYNILLGSSIQVSDSWQLDVTTSHNVVENKDRGVNGYALTAGLQSAISSGAFNPFAAEGQRGSIESTRYIPEEKTLSQLSSVDVKAAGDIFEMGAGPLAAAIGTTFTFQKYEDIFDDRSVNDEVFGNSGSSGGGQRDTKAAYTEVSIPLSKELEMQVAARYDRYSDFGDTVNPKLAVLYHVTPSLLLRGSVGTGFKAPLMQDLYAATSNGYPTFVDQVSCDRERQAGGATPSCNPKQYQVTSSGNTGLKEEKSLSYNLGAVFEPTSDFNIGTDLFMTKLSNVVGIDYDDAMIAESRGVNLSNYGVIVTRDAGGYIESVVAPQQNLSSREIAGVDLSTSYRIHQWKIGVEHSQLFFYKEEGFPGAGFRDKLGENGRPAWRNSAALGYSPSEQHDLNLIAQTLAGHEKAVKENGKLPAYTSFDFQYAYKSKNWGTFSIGVRNLLATNPPIDDSNPTKPLDTTLYDQIGRQFIAGYKIKF